MSGIRKVCLANEEGKRIMAGGNITCSDCGNQNPPFSEFCARCGADLRVSARAGGSPRGGVAVAAPPRTAAPADLYERTGDDILRTVAHLYARHAGLYIAVAGLVAAPSTILYYWLAANNHSILISLANIATSILIVGALIRVVADTSAGSSAGVFRTYAAVGAGRFITLLVMMIGVGVVVALGTILLVIPGIYLLVRLLFVPQATVLEPDSGGSGPFGTSWRLVKGRWWSVFGLLIVAVVPLSIVAVILARVLPLPAEYVVQYLIIPAIVWPFIVGMLTIRYLDLQERYAAETGYPRHDHETAGTPPRPLAGVPLAAVLLIAGIAGVAALRQSGQIPVTPLHLNNPSGIAVDPSGNVYIGDTYNNRVLKLAPNGATLGTLQGIASEQSDGSFFPDGIATDQHGYIYVNDGGALYKYSPGGTYLGTLAAVDSNGGIAVDGKGYIYAAMLDKNQVHVFSPSGKLVRSFGHLGHGRGQLDGPRGIAVDRAGNIYVSETGQTDESNFDGRVQKFSPTGKSLGANSYWGNYSFLGSGANGVALDSKGNIYVTVLNPDASQAHVAVLDSALNDKRQIDTGPTDEIAVAPNGSVYAIDSKNLHVLKYSSSGSQIDDWQ